MVHLLSYSQARALHLEALRLRAQQRRHLPAAPDFFCHRCETVHHRATTTPVAFSEYHRAGGRSCDPCEVELGADAPVYLIADDAEGGYWSNVEGWVLQAVAATAFTFGERMTMAALPGLVSAWALKGAAIDYPDRDGDLEQYRLCGGCGEPKYEHDDGGMGCVAFAPGFRFGVPAYAEVAA